MSETNTIDNHSQKFTRNLEELLFLTTTKCLLVKHLKKIIKNMFIILLKKTILKIV